MMGGHAGHLARSQGLLHGLLAVNLPPTRDLDRGFNTGPPAAMPCDYRTTRRSDGKRALGHRKCVSGRRPCRFVQTTGRNRAKWGLPSLLALPWLRTEGNTLCRACVSVRTVSVGS